MLLEGDSKGPLNLYDVRVSHRILFGSFHHRRDPLNIIILIMGPLQEGSPNSGKPLVQNS